MTAMQHPREHLGHVTQTTTACCAHPRCCRTGKTNQPGVGSTGCSACTLCTAGDSGVRRMRTCHPQCLRSQAPSQQLCLAQSPQCCRVRSWLPGWLQRIAEGLSEAPWLPAPLRCHPPSTFSASHRDTDPNRMVVECYAAAAACCLRHCICLAKALHQSSNILMGPLISPGLGRTRQARCCTRSGVSLHLQLASELSHGGRLTMGHRQDCVLHVHQPQCMHCCFPKLLTCVTRTALYPAQLQHMAGTDGSPPGLLQQTLQRNGDS